MHCQACNGSGDGAEAIPVRPAIVMAERCGCPWGTTPPGGDVKSIGCMKCRGTGFSGRVGARPVEHVFGFDKPSPTWHIAITGDVTREDWPREAALSGAMFMAAHDLFRDQFGDAYFDITWRGLLLHDNALYVVGVVAGELPDGWEWLDAREGARWLS